MSPFLSTTRDASTDFKSTAEKSFSGAFYTRRANSFLLISIIFLLVTLAGSACDGGLNKLEKPKEGTILLCFNPSKS